MNAIENKFRELSSKKHKAYLPYVCLGDPVEGFTLKLMKTLQESGADLVEAGIPFSDTLADGQSIQSASDRAIKNGMNVEKALALVANARSEGVAIPIIAMTYYNLVFHFGVERFASELKKAGGDGKAQSLLLNRWQLEALSLTTLSWS